MAANIAILAQDSVLTVGVGKTEINDLLGFSAPGTPSPEIEVTHLQSTAKEFKSGLPDFGQATLSLHCNDSDPGQAALAALNNSGQSDQFELTLNNGDIYAFNAAVLQVSLPTLAVDTVVTRNIVLKFDGNYTFTPGP